MRRRFLLVHNPIAGRRGRHLVHDVVAVLEANGASVDTLAHGVHTLGEALAAPSQPFDAVIAAGGDGTIRALAAEPKLGDLPIGVIPMGTGNVLSHEVGLPRSAGDLALLLLNGPARTFEGAQANGEPFFLMAGVGFDGEVIRRLDTPLKRAVGKAAYAAPMLRTLARPLPELDIIVDGMPHRANWLVAANARRYGGAFVIAPQAGLHRTGLVAVLLRASTRTRLLRQLLALASGRLERAPGVSMLPCRSLSVTSGAPVCSEIDGDPFGPTPLTITAGGATVRLIVPEGYSRTT